MTKETRYKGKIGKVSADLGPKSEPESPIREPGPIGRDGESFYKTCRRLAGLTKERAAELLGVDVRRLYDYENGATVQEDIVDRMAKTYGAPMLALWHIREKTILGREWLPEILPTRSNNDLGFQTILAVRDAQQAEEHILTALGDGALTVEDIPHIDSYLVSSDAATGKLMSAKAYLLGYKNELTKDE